jgi:hypothetical protein
MSPSSCTKNEAMGVSRRIWRYRTRAGMNQDEIVRIQRLRGLCSQMPKLLRIRGSIEKRQQLYEESQCGVAAGVLLMFF